MWLFTTIGFFSVVEKSVEGDANATPRLAVRARVAGDLDALRAQYMPELGPTVETPHNDYHFRASIAHADFARGLARLAEAIHYGNFKTAVGIAQGWGREHVYHDVWSAAMKLEQLPEKQSKLKGQR